MIRILIYIFIIGWIDSLIKGHIKWSVNYDWSKVNEFWKSPENIFKPNGRYYEYILFGLSTFVVIFLWWNRFMVWKEVLYYTILMLCGLEATMYWWSSKISGYERAFWRHYYMNGEIVYPKLRWLDLPYELPWLEKLPPLKIICRLRRYRTVGDTELMIGNILGLMLCIIIDGVF